MTRLFETIFRGLAKRQLERTQPKKTIVITGSIGKTSTTQAIAHVLRESGQRVVSTRHNYNTNLGVPLSILGHDLPGNAKNPISWALLLMKSIYTSLLSVRNVDYFVLELGTDRPGDINHFAWTHPDIAVVTAVAPEHMENFASLENVAKEELSAAEYSSMVLINRTMVADTFLQYAKNDELYHYDASLLADNSITKTSLDVIGDHSLDAVAAALWVVKHEKIDPKVYKPALTSYTPPAGRMKKLNGKYGSTIIDDTYNSSPEAAIAALKYLYSVTGRKRIVLLGNMNELGDTSAALHKEVGQHCNKTKLDLVVTLGEDANQHTASAAEKNGCRVVRTASPKQAGNEILKQLKEYDNDEKSIVLCKGSQNGVYAEEAVKKLLSTSTDARQLVRQSKRWKEIKKSFWVEV